jgi:hypothetical protein
LTQISDRLPALSGIMVEFQARTGNRPIEFPISERISTRSLDPFGIVLALGHTHDVILLERTHNSMDTYRRIGVGVIHVGTETLQDEMEKLNIVYS